MQNRYIHFNKEIQIKENIDVDNNGDAKISLKFVTYTVNTNSVGIVTNYKIDDIIDSLYGVFKFSQVTQIEMANTGVATSTTPSTQTTT